MGDFNGGSSLSSSSDEGTSNTESEVTVVFLGLGRTSFPVKDFGGANELFVGLRCLVDSVRGALDTL